MYFIVDLGQPKMAKLKDELLERARLFGIKGELGRVSPLASGFELARRAAREGKTTIIAVGDDRLCADVASALIGTPVAFGVIPTDLESVFTSLIGAKTWQEALDIVRMRRILEVDTGLLEYGGKRRAFLTQIEIVGDFGEIELDFTSFTARTEARRLSLINGQDSETLTDGLLEVRVIEERSSWLPFLRSERIASRFVVPQTTIGEVEGRISYLGVEIGTTPCRIGIVPRSLRLIVSRKS